MDTLKTLPQNLEAERAVIGSIINNNDSICDVIDILSTDDFYRESHKILYKALVDMYNRNVPIDSVTLINQLGAENIKTVGGITYITELIGSVLSSYNINYYAAIVKEKAEWRRIIKSCSEAMEKAFEESGNVKTVVGALEDKLMNVGIENSKKILSDEELMLETMNMITTNYEKGGDITGITTGYKSLDSATNGFVKGDFVVIAARPSMGKTCFALNMANNIPADKKVALFEMEMTAEKLGARRLAARSTINATNLPRGKLADNEWSSLNRNISEIIVKNNVFTDTTAGQTIQEIKAKCKKIKLQHGLDVVIIDHLTLIQATNTKDIRVNQVAEITRNIKLMAKDLDVAVVVLSQLSRAPEQRADHRPILSDLRESGTIEQDADLIMFLYRDEYYDKQSEDRSLLECIIAKQRDGRIGTIKFGYLPQYQLVTEII